MRVPALALVMILSGPATAQDGPLELQPLGWPVDCTLGITCHIQHHVDRDPGPGITDHACGILTYDGHQGTDIRLADNGQLDRQVAVLAMTDGTVTAVRDGVQDTGAVDASDDRACGNGIRIDHGGGWESQYCHLGRGSVRVTEGARVLAGEPLAAIGLSGRTEFPHLHVTIRNQGEVVDPFRPDSDLTCETGDLPGVSLWADPPAYRPGGILSAGFNDAVPDYQDVQDGLADIAVLRPDADALVLWGFYFGNVAGDLLEITISAPDGSLILDEALRLGRAQAQAFRAIGAPRPRGGWSPGIYRGRIALIRDGVELDVIAVALTVRPDT